MNEVINDGCDGTFPFGWIMLPLLLAIQGTIVDLNTLPNMLFERRLTMGVIRGSMRKKFFFLKKKN